MTGRLDAYAPWLTLLHVKNLAGQRLRRLVSELGSPEAILSAQYSTLCRVQGIGEQIAQGIREAASGKFNESVQKELTWLKKHGASVISYKDAEYPAPLSEIHSPPVLLYVRGSLQPVEPAIAIVGSRSASEYGRRLAGKIAEELAERGMTIISGLAHGIDGAAHKGALRAHGRTIAVMGCGLKTIYPRHHKDLAEQIVRSGAVITELTYSVSPQRKNFVPRNRIIAGLSWGTVVVEAAEKSGALSTAHFAQEENREVFAIPGRASDETSRGTNKLIQENGAQLATCADDILAALKERFDLYEKIKEQPGGAGNASKRIKSESNAAKMPKNESTAGISPQLDDDEAVLYDTLSDEAIHIDDLARITSMEIGRISSLLGLMELRGLVERLAGARFRRMR